MRIVFKRVELHNFMSFSDEVFEFDKQTGLNLICGKNNDIPGSRNGVGKSQLFESLCFSLYGQTRNNIKNVNIHNKYIPGKETRVVTYFDIESHHYKVASGFNKYGAPYCTLTEIVENDEIDLTKSTIMETRKYLETEILHCDLSIFLRTILLSSDQNYNFFRLRKGEKKEFIEKLFDISVFGDMYASIHRDILNKDKEILAYQNKLLVLNKAFDEYKERIEKYNKDNEAKMKLLTEKLENLQKKHAELKNTNVKLNKAEVMKYEHAIDVLSEAISNSRVNITTINNKTSQLKLSCTLQELCRNPCYQVIVLHKYQIHPSDKLQPGTSNKFTDNFITAFLFFFRFLFVVYYVVVSCFYHRTTYEFCGIFGQDTERICYINTVSKLFLFSLIF